MLIGQHLALTNPEKNAKKDFVGILNPKTRYSFDVNISLLTVTQDAAENAKFICQDFYGLWGGPEVRFIGRFVNDANQQGEYHKGIQLRPFTSPSHDIRATKEFNASCC
jgi:hypothetical protein